MCTHTPRLQHYTHRPFLPGLTNIGARDWHVITYLVVAGDGDIDVSERRVGVAQSDGGNVHIRSFGQRLVVSTRVSHDQEAGLPEGSLNLIGERTGREASGEGGCTGGRGELEHRPLKETEPIKRSGAHSEVKVGIKICTHFPSF